MADDIENDSPRKPPLADSLDDSNGLPLADLPYKSRRPKHDRYREPPDMIIDEQIEDDDNIDELAAISPKLAERRIKIEELRARIDERRADHEMMLELRKEDFKEQEFQRDRDLLLGNNENWMKTYWRPAAGWIYLIICFMDFVGFPLMSMLTPVAGKFVGMSLPYSPWESITLSQGGLIHLSFGAILGVSAWTRGQEKLAAMNKFGSA